MKKLFTLLMVLFVGTMLYAAAGSYVVESVTGNVTYESAPGKFEKVKVGQELSASTVLNTGLNSSVVVNYDGKTITIKAKQKGTVESLYVAAAPAKGGLKRQSSIAKADAVDSADGKSKGVATASSRASEAKEDYTWDE
ncbi:MAG: hypothetical protein IK102_11640 [Treponema sp.]|nr:hypothetical protein [Treponema sp.]